MRPPIVVSSLDMERLEHMLDSLPPAQAATRETLLAELARAELVEPQDMPRDVVTMNSRVRFVTGDAAQEFDMSLAYPKDLDGAPGKLSVLTPVGSALLGLKVGDSIDWTGPGGAHFDVTVREIVYQPERAGDLHR